MQWPSPVLHVQHARHHAPRPRLETGLVRRCLRHIRPSCLQIASAAAKYLDHDELSTSLGLTIMASTDCGSATVGFLGLGALSCDMARRLLQSSRCHAKGYTGHGGDASSAQRFVALGGRLTDGPQEAAAGCEFLVCTASNAQLIDNMLFTEKTGALEGSVDPHDLASRLRLNG